MVALLGFIGMLALTAVSTIWHGYVFSVLWGWFIVPVFGLPLLSVALATGVILIINFATFHRVAVPQDPNEDKVDKIGDMIAHVVVYPSIVLGIGWIIKQYI